MRRSLARRLSVLLLALSACTGESAGGPGTLNYYFSQDPRSLDPALSTDVPTGELAALLFDNLTQFDPDGRLVPGLARTWEADSTGRTYTFHLRRDAAFQDGRRIGAREVRASFERALTPNAAGGRPLPLLPIEGASAFAAHKIDSVPGIRALDDSTLVLTLEEPLNFFPELLAMPVAAIVPTPVPQDFDQHPTGSGPWRFVSWSHDDRIILAKNPHWWGGAPLMDTLQIRIVPEPLTWAAEYESDRLSVAEIPVGETRRWEEQHAAELQRRPALRDMYIALNTTRGPLRDARVRRALNQAVDVQAVLATVMAGRGVRAAGAIPPGIVGYDSTRAPYTYDPAAARKLLAEAGYPNGFSVKLWRTPRAEYARVAQAVQQGLGRIGVNVEIVERDAASARAAARHGDADLFLTDWYADYPDPENFTYPLFHSRNRGIGGNYAFYSDSALDSLILESRATGDSAKKAALAREIDARVFAAAPWIFLWFPVDLWAVRPDIEGWRIPAIYTGQRWTEVRRVTAPAVATRPTRRPP
ncbi:MAG TPA: ABC transporter substrate-binding protein [Gemmatimonadales bacterium]|nr:ABC transporter substrate-binding protein [Gemmatimonadales bacterium]